MRNNLAIFLGLFLLAACDTNKQDADAIKTQAKQDAGVLGDKAERSATRVADTVRDNIKATGTQMRKWWLTPPPSNDPVPVPASYCYRVLQDVNCYRAPLPGETARLVGYQGDGALPPEPAQTKPLPASRISQLPPSAAAAAKVANAKPVFVSIPTPVKEDKTTLLQGGVPAVGSEPLPDPALSPQL